MLMSSEKRGTELWVPRGQLDSEGGCPGGPQEPGRAGSKNREAVGGGTGVSPARMKSRSWKAVLKRVLAMRFSWASRARKARQLSKARRPAPTAKLHATWLLLRTHWSCEESVLFW